MALFCFLLFLTAQHSFGQNAKTYFEIGKKKVLSGNQRGGIVDFDKAIKLDSTNFSYYNVRGVAKFELKDYAGAIKDYTKAIKYNPVLILGYQNRILARIQSKATNSEDLSPA